MMEMNEIKMELITESTCRLCLLDGEDSQLIFESDCASLDGWIEDLTSLKIIDIPHAPASLCSNCNTILRNFDEFRKMCISNNNIFNKLVENIAQKNKLADNNSSNAAQNVHNEGVNSNFTETTESMEFENFKVEVEEDSSSIDPIKEHKKEAVEQIENKEEPKIRGQKICPVCKVYVSGLGKHVFTQHKDYRPYQCEYCSRRFNVRGNLSKHIRRHLDLRTFICQYCEKGFIDNEELKVHIRMHTNEKPYQCTECGTSFKTTGSLRRHKVFHHQGVRSHECEICGAKFFTTVHLKRHKNMHTKARPYGCKICNKMFSRPETTKVTAHKCIVKS